MVTFLPTRTGAVSPATEQGGALLLLPAAPCGGRARGAHVSKEGHPLAFSPAAARFLHAPTHSFPLLLAWTGSKILILPLRRGGNT